ncbi:MAG: hypothetical protein A4E37_01329 [Methanoregulaceae archaeon PtaB.Bin056]|nr:MAG: hypothetical protein A4E37_01329 [Methanoregulaceae archaeon PtaB.Bin056]
MVLGWSDVLDLRTFQLVYIDLAAGGIVNPLSELLQFRRRNPALDNERLAGGCKAERGFGHLHICGQKLVAGQKKVLVLLLEVLEPSVNVPEFTFHCQDLTLVEADTIFGEAVFFWNGNCLELCIKECLFRASTVLV